MWVPREKDVKHYSHFDAPLTIDELTRIANDPASVVANPFFPLIMFKKEWQPYRAAPRPNRKVRELRYAARKDAAIYARYRALLSDHYESHIKSRGLDSFVIGYRRIADDKGTSGKTNIHFARDVFEFVARNSPCVVVVADISKFFESMDHALLKERWETVLGVQRLPQDHFTIFKQVTNYRVIEQEDLFEKIGFAARTDSGLKYTKRKKEMPKQLTDVSSFRSLFDKKNPDRIKIYKHSETFGIPQGLPISDLLANIYMMEFDEVVGTWCSSKGGLYQRYSDDIICIIPGADTDASEVVEKLKSEIKKNGDALVLKDSKVTSGRYGVDANGKLRFALVSGRAKNGIEYLGFRFDGQKTFLRDKTLSNLNRKFKRRINGSASGYVRRYKDKSDIWLQQNFDVAASVSQFLRKERFDESDNPKNWTFWTYARKAEIVLNGVGPRIFQQLSGFKRRAAPYVELQLKKAVMSRKPR
jgi:Reverse transcriptase (RNA-dependent DNA polymerase)